MSPVPLVTAPITVCVSNTANPIIGNIAGISYQRFRIKHRYPSPEARSLLYKSAVRTETIASSNI
jgi:hypothetical protein